MNIINKLSIKNLKLNKKRTISTLIGIILSVALICAVASMGTSFRKTLVQNAINETGYYHIKIDGLNDEELENLKNNRDIKDIKITYDMGNSYLKNNTEEDNPYIYVYSLQNIKLEDLGYKLTAGRAPANENEIVIGKRTNTKANYKIGDSLELEIGKRQTLDEYELNEKNPVDKSLEKLVDTTKKTYKIVGIVEHSGMSQMYYCITINEKMGEISAYCSLKKPVEYKTSIPEILKVSNYNSLTKMSEQQNTKYDYSLNHELLRWEVFAFSDSTISMLYSVIGVVIFIIVFTSVFCIRNSFAISITEKTKMYAMLRSIGATKKQVRKSVIFEAIVLGTIGIPLGILSGIFAVYVLIKIVNLIVGDYLLAHVDGIVFNISIISILISIVLGYITIYLSARASSKRASKISPIEGLKNLNDIKIKNKKLKVPKIISKLFKMGGVLAYKNLKRSKKKYRTTVISLAVSIFVFITMNSFITNMFNFTGNYYEDYDYNMILRQNVSELDDAKLNQIKSSKNVEECFILYETANKDNIRIEDLTKINLEYTMDLSEDSYIDEKTNKRVYTGKKYSSLEIKALDNESFKKYCKKIGADYEKVKNSGILCDISEYYNEETKNTKETRRYNYQINDTITGIYEDKEINIKVGAISDIKPYGIEKSFYYGGYLILNKDEYKDLNLSIDVICLQSNNTEDLEKEIKQIDSNIIYTNFDEEAKQEKSMILVINIFLYGFIAVITLIGVTNIFNTITSNMELRQKEFAMLKSIGMTKKEFNNMINLETIFYGTKSLIYGIILGLLGTFAIYKAFSVKIDKGIYIPIQPIIISAVFVFILVFIIMKYSLNKINKQNTIETIRKENI